MLFLARIGCQWRYLPERYAARTAVWAQWRRWRANGVRERAMIRLAAVVRVIHDREPRPSMVVDAQSVKGGRYGPTFHDTGGPGGRVFGTKRSMLVDMLRLPVAAHACSARPHDVTAARELLRAQLPELPRLRAIVGDRALPGPDPPRRAEARGARHQGAAARPARLHADSSPLQDRARLRPTRPLAAPVALASVGHLAWRAAA